MKKGDVVMIYEDPRTKEKPEGKAKLIIRLVKARNKYDLEYWKVKFLSDRTIVNRHVDTKELQTFN